MTERRFVKHPRLRRVLLISLIVLILIAAAAVYAADYYRADEAAGSSITDPAPGIRVETGKRRIAFIPDNPEAGLIFYPGGKVEYTAYAPLMEKLAEKGVLCVILKMPFNLAVLDANAAEGVADDYPEVDHWAVGGHSLGGAMAASYAAKHPGSADALVLLAAYSTSDLTGTGMKVISIYGTEDGVMNAGSYEKYRGNLPADFSETVIDGGCHSYFGNYGLQKGDGEPFISREEQQDLTASTVAGLIS